MDQAIFADQAGPAGNPGAFPAMHRKPAMLREADRWFRFASASLVVGMHGAIAVLLWNHQPARDSIADAVPIMISWITPARPEPIRELAKVAASPTAASVATRPPIAVTSAAPENQAVVESRVAPLMPAQVSQPVASIAAPTIDLAKPEAAPLPEIIPPRFDAAYLENPPPSYPALSRRLREKGVVLLRVMVGTGGGAERVELRSSSGSPRLDDAALDAVRRWHFVPARQGAQSVPAWVLVPVSFSLEG